MAYLGYCSKLIYSDNADMLFEGRDFIPAVSIYKANKTNIILQFGY